MQLTNIPVNKLKNKSVSVLAALHAMLGNQTLSGPSQLSQGGIKWKIHTCLLSNSEGSSGEAGWGEGGLVRGEGW